MLMVEYGLHHLKETKNIVQVHVLAFEERSETAEQTSSITCDEKQTVMRMFARQSRCREHRLTGLCLLEMR